MLSDGFIFFLSYGPIFITFKQVLGSFAILIVSKTMLIMKSLLYRWKYLKSL